MTLYHIIYTQTATAKTLKTCRPDSEIKNTFELDDAFDRADAEVLVSGGTVEYRPVHAGSSSEAWERCLRE